MIRSYGRLGPLLLVPLALLGGCKPRNQYRAPPAPEVTVARPLQRDVTNYLEETGELAATNSVALEARVQGYLENIGYRDGAQVAMGTPLFTIEPAPYAAQLAEAKANLAAAVAKAAFSDRQYARYAALAKSDSTSRQQAEQTLSDRDANEAAVKQQQAAVEQAEITYGYTQVAAPFDGIVTAHQADVGTLVGGSQTTQLATIVQLDPIWVNFNVSEEDVLRVRGSMAARGIGPADLHNVPVEIGLADEPGYPHTGHLDYVAPEVDTGTGTLAVRGVFANQSQLLLPGYYVHIRIPTGVHKAALLVPERALGNDQGGRTLLVVTPENVVESRNVTLGQQDGPLQVVDSGLKPDDRVIVEGLQRVRPGQKVVPHEVAATTLAAAAADRP